MKLISYQRSAIRKYSNESKSVKRQRAACKFWTINNKHELIERYHDNGLGSYKQLAPNLQLILREIIQGNPKFKGVVVYSYSRISRNIFHLIQVKNILNQHKIRLFSVTES